MEFLTKGIIFWLCIAGLFGWWFRRSGGLGGLFGNDAADKMKDRAKEKALEYIWNKWLK